MATTTKRGGQLWRELNDALGDAAHIPSDRVADVSLLLRRAERYATRQEQACTYEWACGDRWDRDERRLEDSIREVATSLPGVVDVTFQGDPRGYVVRLQLVNKASNNWGNDGWGIA